MLHKVALIVALVWVTIQINVTELGRCNRAIYNDVDEDPRRSSSFSDTVRYAVQDSFQFSFCGRPRSSLEYKELKQRRRRRQRTRHFKI